VKWLHYDRLGNVMNKSGLAGTSTDTYHQDAYGNVLSNVNTGAWASASSFSGRHLTTKEYDGDANLYYFWQRWYDPQVGRFISHAEYLQVVEHPYGYVLNRPSLLIDVDGLKPNKPPKKSEPHVPKQNPINPMDIYDLCQYTRDCAKAIQELNRAYAPGGACDKYFKNPHDITCLACCKALVDFYNTCSKGGLGVGKQIAERCVMDCTDL